MSSNKFPLSWHETCLASHHRTDLAQRAKLEREMASLARSEQDAEFYARQIEEAKNRGLKEFDRGRLLKPRSAKIA